MGAQQARSQRGQGAAAPLASRHPSLEFCGTLLLFKPNSHITPLHYDLCKYFKIFSGRKDCSGQKGKNKIGISVGGSGTPCCMLYNRAYSVCSSQCLNKKLNMHGLLVLT